MSEREDDDVNPDSKWTIHEALHTSWVVKDTWERHVIEHPALRNKPEIRELAEKAVEMMMDAYQAIAHVRWEEDNQPDRP